MTPLLTAAGMRAIERTAIEGGAVTARELMERAGQGAVSAMLSEWPGLSRGPHRAVVLCGPGNNGGDGFVVARLLKARGWEVEVLATDDGARQGPDARAMRNAWCALGPVAHLAVDTVTGRFTSPDTSLDTAPDSARDANAARPLVVIDALFGIGLSRPVGDLASVFRAIETLDPGGGGHPVHRVALDMPSGVCSDSGRILHDTSDGSAGAAFRADLTLAFHALKLGHVLADGPSRCGRMRCVDIGLADDIPPGTVQSVGPPFPHLEKGGAHKFDHGHALILSGGVGRGGAARLAARAALRIGAGLVTVGCPPAALIENAAQLNAIMLHAIRDGAALGGLLGDARINALCLGPGLGTGAREAGLLQAALAVRHEGKAPANVLDGDALTLLAQDDTLFGALHDRCVLTPHGGEFARLFPDLAERLSRTPSRGPAGSRLDATREAAARAGCIVVFKGADTVIADPAGRASVHVAAYARAVPWLATAGAGDVLAGFVTGLLARGHDPAGAAQTAAWLHVECARRFGPGLIAEDLPERLPRVLRAL